MKFVFMRIIQAELTKLVTEWNHHVIRHSRYAECPGGIPEVLYHLPEMSGIIKLICLIDAVIMHCLSGVLDHKHSLDTDLYDFAKENYGGFIAQDCDDSFKPFAHKVMEENHILARPKTASDALDLLSLLISDMQ